MPHATNVDSTTWPAVQADLHNIAAVERALLDEADSAIWIIAEAGAEEVPLELAVGDALKARGIDPASFSVRVVPRPGRGLRRRVRLVDVRRSIIGERLVRIRVTLEWQDKEFTGDAEGEQGPAIELKTAGMATVSALRAIVGDRLDVRLVGIKEMRAFDSDLLIASMWSAGPPPRRCVGAVLDSGEPIRTAAMTVLNGLNRTIGNFLDSE